MQDLHNVQSSNVKLSLLPKENDRHKGKTKLSAHLHKPVRDSPTDLKMLPEHQVDFDVLIKT